MARSDAEYGNRDPREINRKHAPDVRTVARINAARARFDGPPAEREAARVDPGRPDRVSFSGDELQPRPIADAHPTATTLDSF